MSTEITKQQRIESLLEERKDKFEKALAHTMPVDKFISIVRSSITKNPKLLNCTPTSLLNCAMDCAQLGLAPDNALGRAYLIPFGDTATLVIGYKGLVELAYRTGKIASIDAEVVYAGDHFKYQFGSRAFLDHTPKIPRPKDAKAEAVYCVVRFRDGSSSFRVMSVDEIESIRQTSKNKNSDVWKKDWDEMAKKTVFRRLSKMIQLSTDFQEAVARDQEREFEFDNRTVESVITATSKPDISTIQQEATDAEVSEVDRKAQEAFAN